MNGFRSKRRLQYLQGLDYAEHDRKDFIADVEAMFDDGQSSARMLGLVIIFILAICAGLVAWALPDIAAWAAGSPVIVVRVQ